jgi:hypothetical protein
MARIKRTMALGLVGRDAHVKNFGPTRPNRYRRSSRHLARTVVMVVALFGVILFLASALAR